MFFVESDISPFSEILPLFRIGDVMLRESPFERYILRTQRGYKDKVLESNYMSKSAFVFIWCVDQGMTTFSS